MTTSRSDSAGSSMGLLRCAEGIATPLYAALSIAARRASAATALSLASRRGDAKQGGTMTILVTGGGGYIGSHMVHALADAGEGVGRDRQSLDRVSLRVAGVRAAGGRRCRRPERSSPRLIRQHGVDAIIHFAASIVVPDSVRDPLGYYRNNTMNARALLEVAVKTGVRHFIFSSTAAVYGNPERVPVAEDAPLDPMSPYGSFEADDRDHAQGCRRGARTELRDPALLQRRRRRPAGPHRPVDRRRHPSDQGRGRDRARVAAEAARCTAPTIPRPTEPASATTST